MSITDQLGQTVAPGDWIAAIDGRSARLFQITKISPAGNIVCNRAIIGYKSEVYVSASWRRIIHPSNRHLFVKVPITEEFLENVITKSQV